jgi:hypothetical protein
MRRSLLRKRACIEPALAKSHQSWRNILVVKPTSISHLFTRAAAWQSLTSKAWLSFASLIACVAQTPFSIDVAMFRWETLLIMKYRMPSFCTFGYGARCGPVQGLSCWNVAIPLRSGLAETGRKIKEQLICAGNVSASSYIHFLQEQ